jgi:flavin-dependent dehydrogenase
VGAGSFDAVIVGARVAGSTLAALLARRGLNVLLIDKVDFPADTLSTHITYGDSYGIWEEIGAWPEIEAIGAERIRGIDWRRSEPAADIYGEFEAVNGHPYSLCLRRILLDDILVRAAREAGATFLPRTACVEVLRDQGRVTGVRYERRGLGGAARTGTAHADVVVGADGRFSLVAEIVGSAKYSVVPPIWFPFYCYAREVDSLDRPLLEIVESPEADCVLMLAPCDDGIWIVVIYAPQRLFDEFRRDHEGEFWRRLRADPRIGPRIERCVPITPIRGRGDFENFLRVPAGPGWALVGDAGQHKDAIYGQGIGDATRTARLLADHVEQAARGELPLDAALAEFASRRDDDLVPNYDWMIKGQPAGWEPGELEQFLAIVGTDRPQSQAFVNIFNHGVAASAYFGGPARAWFERTGGARVT